MKTFNFLEPAFYLWKFTFEIKMKVSGGNMIQDIFIALYIYYIKYTLNVSLEFEKPSVF